MVRQKSHKNHFLDVVCACNKVAEGTRKTWKANGPYVAAALNMNAQAQQTVKFIQGIKTSKQGMLFYLPTQELVLVNRSQDQGKS